MLGRLLKLLTLPVRIVGRLFRATAREAEASSKTAANAGGSIVAGAAAADILEEEYREEPPTGVETALFKQLPRPRLTERSASELTLEQAREYAASAKGFYHYRFPLFARGDFFYEEVEQDYLNAALGFEANSIDRRFLEVTTLFRKTLNANTRRMLLYWTPGLFVVTFGAAAFLAQSSPGAPLNGFAQGFGGASAVIFSGAALVGALLAFFVFSWPYKVVQQRNLLNLDNYITSKFARINNNFQVAKRRAVSYTHLRAHETVLAFGGLLALMIYSGAPVETLAIFAAGSLVYALLASAIMRRATAMMLRVIESNEWSRFHIVDLDATIRDHVGEDKLQIVTFRDRNRFE